MPADHSTPQPPSDPPKTDLVVPDAVIEDFLGLGLAYSEWPAEVEKRGHVWYPGLENIIIKKQWEFFKAEIQRLRLEPKIAQSSRSKSRSKSNSLESILKRLKGESWVEGRLDEKAERLRDKRLLGKDAKARCLQKYVREWDKEVALAASPPSVQNSATKPATESAPSQPRVSDNLALEVDSSCSLPELQYSDDTPEPEARPTAKNVDINTDRLHSTYDYTSQLGSSMLALSTQSDPFSVTAGGFDLLEEFQNAVPVANAENSGRHPGSEPPETPLQPPHTFGHDTTVVSFPHSPIGEDGVPTSADYSQGVDLPEPDPNVFKWLETNQVSENFEPAETEAPHSDGAFQGTFLNPHNSFDMNDFIVFEEIQALEATSTTESMSVDLAWQQNSPLGCPEIVSQPIWPPRSSSKGLKRRRQNTSGASLDMPSYGNVATPALGHVAYDGDTVMSSYESSSQPTNELVSQGSWTQLAPLSGPLPMPLWPETTSKPAYIHIREQTELELELQRTREELNLVRKRHQKELESFVRKQQAAEAEISELLAQVQEMKESNEYYERLAHRLNNENIILQEAESRKKYVSGLPSTATKEREYSTKPLQSFPSSKNPRPLSLTLRPATASKGSSTSSSPPRKLSASTLQDTPALQPPIATSPSSMLNSPDNSHVSSEDPVLTHVAHKSTGRLCRPDSANSSQVPSGQPVPASSPSKPTHRNKRSGSADSIAAPNLSTSTRRDLNPLQHFMHKFSDPFLRKRYRDDSSKVVPTVPTLPPLKASVPLDRQMAGVLVDSDKRLTNDSGYDSLRFETRSKTSIADAE